MVRASWRSSDPLDKFTSGYCGHHLDPTAIRQWTAARLRGHTPGALRKWLAGEEKGAAKALAALRALPPKKKVERAIANANQHLQWLRLIRAELQRRKPSRKSRVEVGLLAAKPEAGRGGRV
jgi:hypothetical protein